MLLKLHELDFILNDLNLYLDLNPNDQNIYEKFKKTALEYDILKKKYYNKYQVLDKETNSLRDVKYSDFAIIMDRATNFDLYKRIFSYLGIPINIFIYFTKFCYVHNPNV